MGILGPMYILFGYMDPEGVGIPQKQKARPAKKILTKCFQSREEGLGLHPPCH